MNLLISLPHEQRDCQYRCLVPRQVLPARKCVAVSSTGTPVCTALVTLSRVRMPGKTSLGLERHPMLCFKRHLFRAWRGTQGGAWEGTHSARHRILGHERPGWCYPTGRCAYLPSVTCYRQSIKPPPPPQAGQAESLFKSVWWLHFRPFISLRTASKTTVGTLLCGKVKKSSYSKLLAERSNFSFQGLGLALR